MNEPDLCDVSPGPARPERLTVDFYEEPATLVIHKRRGGGSWLFLLLWLIGWTVGCVVLLVVVIANPTLVMFAFGLPFWASWLFVAGVLVWMIFGKETLLLGRGEAHFLRTAFIRLSSRVVPLKEVQGFHECRSCYTKNDEYLWGIEMLTLGQPVRFAFGLPDRERAWLVHQLNRFLATSGPPEERQALQPAVTFLQTPSSSKTTVPEGTPVSTEVLAFEYTLAEPPTDCRWHVTENIDTFTFWQKGQWNMGPIGVLFLVNAFWNGIVSVFVMVLFGQMPINNPPQGAEWWGLFLFLIPFEAIGLGMFAALVLAVLEPCRHTTWRFERHRVVSQTRWPVYCQTRGWDVMDLHRLELRRRNGNDSQRQRFSDVTTDMTGPMSFELALVASNNIDLCDIGTLTEGEARWMARIVLDRRPMWFGERFGR